MRNQRSGVSALGSEVRCTSGTHTHTHARASTTYFIRPTTIVCGTKCGATLHPAGRVLDQYPARPHPALTWGAPAPRPNPAKSASGACRRCFWEESGGREPPP
eukprot:15458424-Alexandrium_andersonii.AAC.1